MSVDLLVPVSDETVARVNLLPKQIIGKQIPIHTEKTGLPDLKKTDIALFGVSEIRNAFSPFQITVLMTLG